MEKFKPVIWGVLIAALLLASCAPGGTPAPGTPASATPGTPYPDAGSATPPAEGAYPFPSPSPLPSPLPTGAVSGVNGKQPYIPDPAVSAADLDQITRSANSLAVALYQQLAQEGSDNAIISPYSIYQALLMTYAGASGTTATEMAAVLGLPANDPAVHAWMNGLNVRLTQSSQGCDGATCSPDAQPLTFMVANALWGQQDFTFSQPFLDTLSANYNAGLELVDFSDPEQARTLINAWVAAQTNDKIKDLIAPGVLDEMTRLVLTNAVYFKGAWQNQFEPKQTVTEAFTLEDGSSSNVPMMKYDGLSVSALQTDAYQAVSLPYEGGGYAMLALMPRSEPLSAYAAALTPDLLNGIIAELEDRDSALVNLSLPRFKFESSFDLSAALKQFGMLSAFDPNMADFSAMDGAKDLYISALLHKATVDVNEQGTEASAATAVAVGTTAMHLEGLDLRFDHPFLFAIYERSTRTIVFLGRVTNP